MRKRSELDDMEVFIRFRRELFLAVPATAYEAILADDIGRAVRKDTSMPIIVFDPRKEIVQKWLP